MMTWKDPKVQRFIQRPGFEALQNSTLYDVQAYSVAAMSTNKTFFGDGEGQNSKTKYDTNMKVGGQLPSPDRFLLTSINLKIFSEITTNNDPAVEANQAAIAQAVSLILTNGVFRFYINGGDALVTRAICIPGGNAPYYLAAGVLGSAIPTNGVPDIRNVFPFLYPIEENVTWKCYIDCPGTAPTIPVAVEAMIVLNGIYFRSESR